jgi:hypothetical protein
VMKIIKILIVKLVIKMINNKKLKIANNVMMDIIWIAKRIPIKLYARFVLQICIV